jgi:hypothetical protein
MRSSIGLLAIASTLVTGCATTPDVQASYYLPKSGLGVKAIRTVGCNAEGNTLYSATAVTADVSYGPDEKVGLIPIRFRGLDGKLSNSDLTLSFQDDGRLKGVNATTVGRGEEVFKSAIQIAGIALGGGLGFVELSTRKPKKSDACQLIDSFGGKEKMLTLTYAAAESFDADAAHAVNLKLDPSLGHLSTLDGALKTLCLVVGPAVMETPHVTVAPGGDAAINLSLRQPAKVPVSVTEGGDPGCSYIVANGATKIWGKNVPVPQLGKPYSLPIPKGALFGKQTFAVALADSGAITSLQYAKESGAPGMLNVVSAGLTEAQPDSAAAKAAQVKGEADLIAQQQRLIRCQINQTSCT